MNPAYALLPLAVLAASSPARAAAEAPVPVTEIRLPAAKADAPATASVKVAAAAAAPHDAKPAEAKPVPAPVAAKPAEDPAPTKSPAPPKPEAKKTSLMDVAAAPAASPHRAAARTAVPRSAPRAAAEQIVARRGDTLDKLVATRFNHLPFRPDALRAALARVNAGALQPGSRTRLVAGAKVTLPADAEVQRLVLGGDHDDGQAHEPTNPVLTSQGWIRFP